MILSEIQDSICGNGVVEKNEQCDCGWEEDCEESCCFPMRTNPPRMSLLVCLGRMLYAALAKVPVVLMIAALKLEKNAE
ncbi:disintegrin and metalloproteinase domain-containing protein 10, partial [Trichonephila clavata]